MEKLLKQFTFPLEMLLLCHFNYSKEKENEKVSETIGSKKSVESLNTSKDSQFDKSSDSIEKYVLCYNRILSASFENIYCIFYSTKSTIEL